MLCLNVSPLVSDKVSIKIPSRPRIILPFSSAQTKFSGNSSGCLAEKYSPRQGSAHEN